MINYPMGLSGLEPPTSRLSGVRSNRLSYKPSNSGDHLFSHIVSNIVPSAALGLTIVFGMGTGVSPRRIVTGNVLMFLSSECRTQVLIHKLSAYFMELSSSYTSASSASLM